MCLQVDLIPFDAKEHLSDLFSISNGSACYAHRPYDAEAEIWRHLDEGPFPDAETMGRAACMRQDKDLTDGRRFVVKDRASGYYAGMLSLRCNCPSSLRVELADIWITPAFQRTHGHTDACLTILRHLFQLQYRRVECLLDAQNARGRRSLERLGFVLEGVLRKHRIVRDSNQDSALYAMTNSDWRGGTEAKILQCLRPPSGVSSPSARTKLEEQEKKKKVKATSITR